LLELVSRLHGSLLDRHRPLWEYHLIEGLPDSRFATYAKCHHALADGITLTRKVLQSCSIVEQAGTPRPQSEPPRDRYVYYPDTAPVPEGVAVSIRGRNYKIVSNVDLAADADGVIFAHGSRFGGHTMFIKDGRVHYVYNFLGIKPEQDFVSPPLAPGKHSLGTEFKREKAGEHGESIGTTTLYVDGKEVTSGPMRAQIGKFTLAGDGLCVGYDSGDNVSQQYKNPGKFTGGTIQGVAFDVSDKAYVDLNRDAEAAFATD